jgi:hypothetical protein
MPRGVTVVLVRSEHRTTAEVHDAFSGFASLAAGVTFAGFVERARLSGTGEANVASTILDGTSTLRG